MVVVLFACHWTASWFNHVLKSRKIFDIPIMPTFLCSNYLIFFFWLKNVMLLSAWGKAGVLCTLTVVLLRLVFQENWALETRATPTPLCAWALWSAVVSMCSVRQAYSLVSSLSLESMEAYSMGVRGPALLVSKWELTGVLWRAVPLSLFQLYS